MRASLSAPTPMPPARSKTRPHKPWAALWRRSCERKRTPKSTGEEVKPPLRYSLDLSGHFRVWVTVWVRQLTRILTHTSFNVFTTKKHRKPKFSMLFGAAGRIRTADLILTKKPWMRLRCTHSCQVRPPNPLCCKGLKVLPVLVRFSRCQGVLRGFRAFVGRIVGKRTVLRERFDNQCRCLK